MPEGPGVYDDLCTQAREEAEAVAVVLMVIGGRHGSSFCVQADERSVSPEKLARSLRIVADEIERSV